MRVDFMLIGAQKSGTTSLANYLASHPQICFCREKEPQFFSKSPDWRAGLDEYHRLYNPSPGQICGEGSTTYTFLPEWPDTAHRLHDYNPNLKFIYIIRHPVERIVSHYAHRFARDRINRPPQIEVLEDPVYINRSRYAVQLRPYFELFPPHNTMLLIFEEFIADPQGYWAYIAEFLGIDRVGFSEENFTAHNTSVGTVTIKKMPDFVRPLRGLVPAPLRAELRRRMTSELTEKPVFPDSLRGLLWRFLEDDVREIETLLGRPVEAWRNAAQAQNLLTEE